MAQIRVLDRLLVNKIAAGEVVERPASVVKELMENALDAQARRIDVTVGDGGKKLISVADDGVGMSADDLALAFAPHATSKLADDADLEAIATMGFRGEALASVASISHASMRTRRRQDEAGYEVKASADEISPPRPCPAAPGTTVTVADLFFNTPARRKFLRTTNTEMGHVADQFTRLALPHPHVAFTLSHNGREIQNLPAVDTTARRVADLFGRALAETLIPISPRRGDVQIEGLIAPPAAARASGKWQYTFLNGRYIRDRSLSHALREAYRGLTEPTRFPVAFVFIRMDPAEVDVNVHPTKIEVRFRDGRAVHDEMLAALRETLNAADLTSRVSLDAAGGARPDSAAEDGLADQQRQSLREALADFFKSAPAKQPSFDFSHATHTAAKLREGASSNEPRSVAGLSAPSMPMPQTSATAPQAATPATSPPSQAPAQPPQFQAIQIHDSYIVAACEEGLVIVDQHALHERLIYNDLKRRLADDRTDGPASLTGQRMLIPETLDVTAAESAILADNTELLARLGIEVTQFGPSSVAVQQMPSLLAERGVAAGQLIREIIDKLSEDDSAGPEQLLEDMLEVMACKAAVKAGDKLTAGEIDSLLARRQVTEKSSACPHGRPTTLTLTLKDLAKQFKRT